MTKWPDKSNLEKKGVVLAQGLRSDTVHHGGEGRVREMSSVAGHLRTGSTEMDAGASWMSPFHSVWAPSPWG